MNREVMTARAIRPPGFEQTTTNGPRRKPTQGFAATFRPRFLHELVVAPLKDTLVVDGTNQIQVLQGKATRSLVPDLIALMDGSRTVKELVAALPAVPPEYVHAAMSLLYKCGLIEAGTGNRQLTSAPNPEPLGFFRRYVAATRANRCGGDAYDKLQLSEIVILEASSSLPLAPMLKCLLEKSGVGHVAAMKAESLTTALLPAAISPGQPIMVSVSWGEEDYARHAILDDWCARHQLPWLRAVLNGHSCADIGPFFNRRHAPCYRCFYAVHGKAHLPAVSVRPLSSVEAHFWVSLLATEIVYLINRVGTVITGRNFRRYHLENWDSLALQWTRIPGCPRCLPLNHADSEVRSEPVPVQPLETAVVFEEYVGLQSREFSISRTPEQARKAMALARQMKSLPNSQQCMLDGQMPKLERGSLDVLAGTPIKLDQSLSLGQLSSLLMMTAGIRRSWNRDSQVKRWAPTAGNLGSVELFVAARDVEGLAPGFYFYQPREHSLASLQCRRGALAVEEFISRVALLDKSCLPNALVLFTGAYHRVSQKYGPFAYRLINLDAGVALSQLHFVAQSLNIRFLTLPRWADDLIEEQLNLESLQEQSTAVAALFGTAPGIYPDSSRVSPETAMDLLRAAKAAREFCEVTADQVFEMLYEESRIREPELHRLPSSIPSDLLNPTTSTSNTKLLPRPAQGGRLAGEILAGRTSVRNFTNAPVTLEQLATMLFYAHYGDKMDWPAEHQQNLPLTFLALVRHVEGIAQGVYQYNLENHGLSLTMAAPSGPETAELFVQEEFTSAPLVVWIAGNLAAAGVRHGAFGHRQLLLRAGAAGHRLWIAALAMGLSGSLVSGLVPGAARRQLGLDGYIRASLLAFVTGHETTAATFGEPLWPTPESVKLQ